MEENKGYNKMPMVLAVVFVLLMTFIGCRGMNHHSDDGKPVIRFVPLVGFKNNIKFGTEKSVVDSIIPNTPEEKEEEDAKFSSDGYYYHRIKCIIQFSALGMSTVSTSTEVNVVEVCLDSKVIRIGDTSESQLMSEFREFGAIKVDGSREGKGYIVVSKLGMDISIESGYPTRVYFSDHE